MTKSELFKEAHKEARKIVSIVGNYQVAFSYALKELYKKSEDTINKVVNVVVFTVLSVFLFTSIFLGLTTEKEFKAWFIPSYHGVKNLFSNKCNKVVDGEKAIHYNGYIK